MKKYPDVPINIEIKGQADETPADYLHNAEVLADFLNELGRTKGIVVASFNDAALAHFHELAPQIDMAPATGGVAGYVLGNTPPPEGSKVFQVPMKFSGIPVVTPEFVDKAHGDGYAVHPWTIDDEPTMKYLFDLGVDGIMSAQPMRLEKTMCNMDVSRPPLPKGSPGKHCTQEVVDRLRRAGERELYLGGESADGRRIKRRDDFDSRCAGTVVLETQGRQAPGEGPVQLRLEAARRQAGPTGARSTIDSTPKLEKAIGNGKPIRAVVQPYDAFVTRTVVPRPDGRVALSPPARRGRTRRRREAPRPRAGSRRPTARRPPGSCGGGRRGRSSRRRCWRGGRPRCRPGRASR